MKLPAFSLANLILGAVAVAAVGFILWNFDPFHRRQHAEQKAATATVQADINAATGGITAEVAEDTDHIHRKAQEVQDALDASTDMDGDLAIWSAGIDGVLDADTARPDRPDVVPDDPAT